MIISRLRLRNFGPYSGVQVFDLTPAADGHFHRPLVLVTGKNGVGKSTVMEAVRLCVHGNLALGRSVGRDSYRAYLDSRIHRPSSNHAQPTTAAVEVAFDHIVLGKRREYEVRRSWSRTASGIIETLTVSEDQQILTDLTDEQKTTFLRELVPPCVADLFFLDNEKLDALSSDDASSTLLAEMVQSLLGLDLVHRLQRDLDVYLSRAGASESETLSGQYEGALRDEERLAEAVRATQALLRESSGEIQKLRAEADAQEERISGEGHGFAERLGALRTKKETLAADIERQRAVIQDLAGGLMPFGITPKFCQALVQRVEHERRAQRARVAQGVIEQATEILHAELGRAEVWGATEAPPEAARSELAERLGAELQRRLGAGDPGELLLNVSEQEGALLTSWSEESRQRGAEFCQAVARLRALERSLAETERQLAQVPSQETLAPLVEGLNRLHRQIGALQAGKAALDEQRRRQEFEYQQATWRVRDARQKVQEASRGQRSIDLAAKSQLVLEEYAAEVLRRKLSALEAAVTERFNQLCRKPAFVTHVEINPETFSLSLERYGHAFDRSGLSAGEKQLLATAILWAMRDVSRLPIPVFIDTPVARLDTDHRDAMIETLLPRVSHQTILLATDAEADVLVSDALDPLLARVYRLEYDFGKGATLASRQEATTQQDRNLALELAQ